jgi:hypothetical protein
VASYSLWTLIRRHRSGYAVTSSAIALRSEDVVQPGDYFTDYTVTLEQAKSRGAAFAKSLADRIAARGDSVISTDTTVDEN